MFRPLLLYRLMRMYPGWHSIGVLTVVLQTLNHHFCATRWRHNCFHAHILPSLC